MASAARWVRPPRKPNGKPLSAFGPPNEVMPIRNMHWSNCANSSTGSNRSSTSSSNDAMS